MIWNLLRRGKPPAIVDSNAWRLAEMHLPFLARLSEAEQQRLRAMALDFIASKEWHAAQGLILTQAMQLSIALQACLLVLKLDLAWYEDWLGIIVYPGDFVIPRAEMDADGIVHEYADAVLGEAWEGGPVLLSWFEAGDEPEDVNIVIHEFAHKLDMRKGGADGMPPLHRDMSRAAWRAALAPAYENFCARLDGGEETRLDPYGGESPAEFFAVMSEAFFTTPDLLRHEYALVYQQLALFYRQQPSGSATAPSAIISP